jgi:hypothetical protein
VWEGRGVEVLSVDAPAGPRGVADLLHGRGLLSALWLVGGDRAREAVNAGVIQELSIYAGLFEADGLQTITEHFDRPLRVSVMSCDAIETNACILRAEVGV